MKYFRLFEEFTIKYELVKELPEYGAMCFDRDATDKYQSMCVLLEKSGYNWNGKYNPGKDSDYDQFFLIWNKHSKGYSEGYVGYILKRFKGNDMRDLANVDNWPDLEKHVIEFDEYFKLKHEYRGHNLKRFGV